MPYEQAAAAWVGTTGTVILMSKWLWDNVGHQFDDFVDRVDRKNADLGLDRSVNVEDVTLDYIVPFHSGDIERYLERNEYPMGRYLSELGDGVGRPYRLVLSVALLGALLAATFTGPLVYLLWGLSPAAEYFAAVYALILANLFAYFIL